MFIAFYLHLVIIIYGFIIWLVPVTFHLCSSSFILVVWLLWKFNIKHPSIESQESENNCNFVLSKKYPILFKAQLFRCVHMYDHELSICIIWLQWYLPISLWYQNFLSLLRCYLLFGKVSSWNLLIFCWLTLLSAGKGGCC